MMSLEHHIFRAVSALSLVLGLAACSSSSSGTPVEELEAIQIKAEMSTSELTLDGALTVTGEGRDYSLAVAGSPAKIDIHTPGASDLSSLQGRAAKVTVRDSISIGEGGRVVVVSDDAGPLYVSVSNDEGDDNTTFGEGFARWGEAVSTDEGTTFIVEQTPVVFKTDKGDVSVLPSEAAALTIGGAQYRAVVIAAYRVSVNPDADAVPGCDTPDMLSYELLRVEAAPEPKKQLTRLQGGLSPRQGCAFSVD